MILAAANAVGGFVVTDRMLEMFKREPPPGEGGGTREDGKR
jgi:NAD/NADP transhydrogenase alpha subunit